MCICLYIYIYMYLNVYVYNCMVVQYVYANVSARRRQLCRQSQRPLQNTRSNPNLTSNAKLIPISLSSLVFMLELSSVPGSGATGATSVLPLTTSKSLEYMLRGYWGYLGPTFATEQIIGIQALGLLGLTWGYLCQPDPSFEKSGKQT